MERNIQLDWKALVKEAIKRRKSEKITQKQLAMLAGVSGPTVTRFEKQEENITLKSALAILKMLGLTKRE
ncbi:MAG: helix-turn-helix domain-containing protein [Proteobacteria bacterium]|nr:helix-turn-helix domain-containing protein [Pseudomonadota bacterium]